VRFHERDREHGLERDVDEPRERSRDQKEKEGPVAGNHTERTTARWLLRRIRAPRRQEKHGEHEAQRRESRGPDEKRIPASDQEQQAAQRRPEGNPEVRGNANGCVRRFVPIVRYQVGDERLAGCVADLEKEPAEGKDEQAGRRAASGRDEAEHDRRLPYPADQDQRPPAKVIGQMASQVARADADQRAHEIGEPEHGRIGAELLDRPDPDEAPDGRAGERPGEVDPEDRP
jgi:hypothetical protein